MNHRLVLKVLAVLCALLIGVLIATACDLSDVLWNEPKPIVRVDTLFTPGPTDTLYCKVKHGHTVCWR